MREVDLRLTARRRLEPHLKPGGCTRPDAAEKDFDRGVAAIVAETAQLAVQPAGRQLGIGCHALAQVRLKRSDPVGARRPRLVSRRLKASLDVAPDGLAIQPRLPGDRGQAQALPMEVQDQDNFPKPDHPRSPPDRQGKGGLLPGSAPQRQSQTHTATKRGIFSRPIWGNYERH